GAGEKGVWLMSLSFDRRSSPLNEEESRELIVNVVNDYLQEVNKDAALRPYLKDYPFTSKNLELSIFNSGIDGSDIYYPYINIVSNLEGKIVYYTKEETKKFGYKTKKYETWDEAVAILQSQRYQE